MYPCISNMTRFVPFGTSFPHPCGNPHATDHDDRRIRSSCDDPSRPRDATSTWQVRGHSPAVGCPRDVSAQDRVAALPQRSGESATRKGRWRRARPCGGDTITLLDVIECMEGPLALRNACIADPGVCAPRSGMRGACSLARCTAKASARSYTGKTLADLAGPTSTG